MKTAFSHQRSAFSIVRPLPAADQHARELVLGKVEFRPERSAVSGERPAGLAARVARLEERLRADHEGRIERRVRGLQCLTAAEAEAVLMVCQIVGQALGVELSKLLGKSRHWPIARARMAAIWLARTRLGFSQVTVGSVFGNHHSNVLHACRRMRDLASQPSPDQTALLLADRAVQLWCEQRRATP